MKVVNEDNKKNGSDIGEVIVKLTVDKEMLDGLWTSDEEVDKNMPSLCITEEDIPIYGEVDPPLEDCEKKVLRKPPKHTIQALI